MIRIWLSIYLLLPSVHVCKLSETMIGYLYVPQPVSYVHVINIMLFHLIQHEGISTIQAINNLVCFVLLISLLTLTDTHLFLA